MEIILRKKAVEGANERMLVMERYAVRISGELELEAHKKEENDERRTIS